ncbi:MAG: Sulfur carrier protein ThiS [Holophagaceae bacterium]|nr:Sulfur carrier protein ThiS [Holophagaceae bacterium]
MKLIINGKATETPTLTTIAELATWMELPSYGTAVELNGTVVRKADHASTPLREGDQLEVVRFVGGG